MLRTTRFPLLWVLMWIVQMLICMCHVITLLDFHKGHLRWWAYVECFLMDFSISVDHFIFIDLSVLLLLPMFSNFLVLSHVWTYFRYSPQDAQQTFFFFPSWSLNKWGQQILDSIIRIRVFAMPKPITWVQFWGTLEGGARHFFFFFKHPRSWWMERKWNPKGKKHTSCPFRPPSGFLEQIMWSFSYHHAGQQMSSERPLCCILSFQ